MKIISKNITVYLANTHKQSKQVGMLQSLSLGLLSCLESLCWLVGLFCFVVSCLAMISLFLVLYLSLVLHTGSR